MKRLFNLVVSLFLVLTLTFTTVVKPTIALTIASPGESYIEAIPDEYSKTAEQIELYETAKKGIGSISWGK